MFIFKCGFIVILSTFIVSVSFGITKETNTLDTGLAFLYIASGAIAGKIIFDRYQQVHILGSLTCNPNVTSFANRIASLSAILLSVGFLVYILLYLFKVDNRCLVALSIFVCGFGTLYMWMQCIITTYISTLFYDKYLSVLRQCLANLSFLVIVIMAVFGTATSLLPKGSSNAINFCFLATYLCSYVIAAIFSMFILSYEKEYQYFAEGTRADMLIDDARSLNEDSLEDVDLFRAQEFTTNAMVIKGTISCAKMS